MPTKILKKYVVEHGALRYDYEGKGAKMKALSRIHTIRSGGNQAKLREYEYRNGQWMIVGGPEA